MGELCQESNIELFFGDDGTVALVWWSPHGAEFAGEIGECDEIVENPYCG